jgi:hypothetical protein
MQDKVHEAIRKLTERIEVLLNLYPEMESLGTAAYMCDGKRLHFSIKLKNGKRKSIQYARLLLECSLNRRLVNDETVDHVDGDWTNNEIENLQVLSKIDNARKGPNAEVRARMSAITSIKLTGKEQPWNQGEKNGLSKLTNNQVLEIKQLQMFHYRGQDKIIAIKYGVSRELISQIRRGVVRV